MLSVHRNRSRRAFWKRFVSFDAAPAGGESLAAAGDVDLEDDRVRSARASRALAMIPAVQREAVVLHDVDGFTMEEIAAIQDVTISAVKTRVSRGRERLRRHYERLGYRGASRVAEQDSDHERNDHRPLDPSDHSANG